MIEYIKGTSKVIAENNGASIRLTWFEKMGARCVALGPSEDWEPSEAADILKAWKE